MKKQDVNEYDISYRPPKTIKLENDERQVARALQLGSDTANSCGWQYLVTMNPDDLPGEFSSGFDIERHILPVRLSDVTETGGLFGLRF